MKTPSGSLPNPLRETPSIASWLARLVARGFALSEDHPAIIGFRRELEDDLIRADTVRQVLGLIRLAIEAKLS